MPTLVPRLAGRGAMALLLVLLAAGTVLATAATRSAPAAHRPAEETAAPTAPIESPSSDHTAAPAKAPDAGDAEDADEADASPSPANLERIVAKLAAKDIATSTDQLAALAKEVGLGGAVRVLIFADASGKAPAEILAMFEDGKGWGVIAKELEIDVNPGLGWVMGNGKGPDREAKAAEKAARAEERAAAKAEREAAKAERRANRAQQRGADD